MALGAKPEIWNINVGNLCRDMGVVDENSSVWGLATNRAVVTPRLSFLRCYNDLVGHKVRERLAIKHKGYLLTNHRLLLKP
jgi:hypothetical protein